MQQIRSLAPLTVVPTAVVLGLHLPVYGGVLATLVVAAEVAIVRLPARQPRWLSHRTPFALAAILHGAALAASVAATGPEGIHLSALRAGPGAFHLLFTVPLVGLVTFGLLAVFPLLLVNLAFLLVLWLGVEVTFGILHTAPVGEPAPEGIDGGDYFLPDDELGYIVAPEVTARHRVLSQDEVDFDVTYVIDSLGRRATPLLQERSTSRFLLFFGGSNTFGEGLQQDETLPAALGTRMPGYRPYNYGLHGYGPAQALDLTDVRDIASEVAERRGYALFIFIPAHMGRVVGSSEVAPAWGSGFSYYGLDEAGKPRRLGSFERARPFATLGQSLWNQSRVVRYFGLRLPLRYSDDDYRLAARILRALSERLEDAFEEVSFFVVMAPTTGTENWEILKRLSSELQTEGISVIDLSRIVDFNERAWRVADTNWHHSWALNQVLADMLALRLTESATGDALETP